MKSQQGFTLIELVVVIVLLGILAAAAIPRFVDLSAEAEDASLRATVNALQSASVLNFAQRKIDPSKGTVLAGLNGAICDKAVIAPIMMGGWPDAYILAPGGTNTAATDDAALCKVTSAKNSAVTQDDVPVVRSSQPKPVGP